MKNTDKDKSQRQIELLQVLAEGCRKHLFVVKIFGTISYLNAASI